jgi:S-DNA-T family DNA segregation ATPase FtsK/SpoIIIE
VMGSDDKAHSDVLCSRLASEWPDRYAGWTAGQLSAALKPYGVRTRQVWATGLDGQTANRYGVVHAELFAALGEPAEGPSGGADRGDQER